MSRLFSDAGRSRRINAVYDAFLGVIRYLVVFVCYPTHGMSGKLVLICFSLSAQFCRLVAPIIIVVWVARRHRLVPTSPVRRVILQIRT